MPPKTQSTLSRYLARAAVTAAAAGASRRTRSAGSSQRSTATRYASSSATSRTKTARSYRGRRRRRTIGDTSGEYARTNTQYGRPARQNLSQLRRVIKAQTERIQFTVNAVSEYGGTNGNIWMENRQSALGGQLIAPVMAYDVTSAMNVVNGVISTPVTGHQLRFTNETDTASVQWQNFNFGTWNYTLQAGPEAASGFDNYPNEKSYLRWVNAKMVLYAPTALPVRWQIELVQFKDERLVPSAPLNGTGFGGVGGALGDTFSTGFWQYMAKKFMYNPIMPLDNTYKRYYKVLKRLTIYQDPKETSENVSTRYREIDLMMWLNRMCNYRWNNADRVNMQNADDQVSLDPQNQTTVHPRARVFLLIRAISGKVTGVAATATKNPSYDIYLKARHDLLN